jgi:hypothetical protein
LGVGGIWRGGQRVSKGPTCVQERTAQRDVLLALVLARRLESTRFDSAADLDDVDRAATLQGGKGGWGQALCRTKGMD